ncbi:uncharacterized protein A1O9_03809 [Exophiala aquamarina CBS 119918]|uniref:Clr5 domain-containing protein n=1 Tax=Exophiala aquamarina CBS 119918 TaxID=1182545 RepID=A0A072PGI0_9EURO|nr:uncharacterized protein A1O9_03809 [Exophiala aquamarina CBS 119918]KEF58966.1 hypothetical protein A1O9_03809 [Exophiala aquamarina CBS 119918]
MAGPYSSVQLTQVKRVESQSAREARFSTHRGLIKQLYVENDMPLRDLMEHMKVEYGFNQTMKPWKTQLNAWGYKHHLTVKDAAHILRCLDQAPLLGYQDAVLFSGKLKTRQHITKYIQRSRDITSELDLLSRIPKEEPTPEHIKYLPVAHTPPLSGSPGSLIAPTGSAEISPMIKPMPSPLSTPRSSQEFLVRPGFQGGGLGPNQYITHYDHLQNNVSFDRVGQNHDNGAEQQAIPGLVMPFKLPDREPRLPAGRSTTEQLYAKLPRDVTVAALSADPIDLSKLGITPTDERHGLGFDILGRGDYTRCPLVNDNNSYAALFVDNCLYWCYCVGQENPRFQEHAQYHLQTARSYFVCMLQDTKSPGEDCLAALSVMTTLFDCLGHTQRLSTILTVCDQDTRRHSGANNPLTKTIAFKKSFLDRRQRGERPKHDLKQLKDICEETKKFYPNSLGPALTARYNWAWAMLEMRHLKEAQRQLKTIAAESRAHFGVDHIQTIMSAATLARATLYCGDTEAARRIIVNDVCPSVRRNFPRDHPYTWEANHRQAIFLEMLAKDADENSRYEYLWTAEELLREVVIERHRVLGDSNPKSVHSFRLLKNILEQQGKSKDAANLWAWCQYKLSLRERA